MLKAGIFLDEANLSRCGGWGFNVRVVRSLVESQGFTIMRANTYLAVDKEREQKADQADYADRNMRYRDALRREGFHIVAKEVKHYLAEGEVITKANADIDLAVDALLQSESLDYVLLGTGDGDFLRLVLALQDRGKRVDLLAFSNVSGELRREVDYYFDGYMVPGLLPPKEREHRGFVCNVSNKGDYGFITYRTGFKPQDISDDIFVHISSFNDPPIDAKTFFELQRARGMYIEFNIGHNAKGPMAMNARVFKPV